MDSSIVSYLKPIVEALSSVAIVVVGWLYAKINKNETYLKDHVQDLNDFKVHVARHHPTHGDIENIKKDIIREMQTGFESVRELINAEKNK